MAGTTKILAIPKITGSDPLINLPDQNGRALDQLDTLIGNPSRVLAKFLPTTIPQQQFVSVNLSALIAVDFKTPTATTISVQKAGTYLITSRFYLDPGTSTPNNVGITAQIRNLGGRVYTETQQRGFVWPAQAVLAQSGVAEIAAQDTLEAVIYRDVDAATWKVSAGFVSVTWLCPLTGATPINAMPDPDPLSFAPDDLEGLG